MSETVLTEGDEGVILVIKDTDVEPGPGGKTSRSPVHVVYGGADRYSIETPAKFGRIALESLKTYAPDFVEFATVFGLEGCDSLPSDPAGRDSLSSEIENDPDGAISGSFAAWFAWSVHKKTITKLEREPVEDLRIDLEDGYGFRSAEEEDGHAASAAAELAAAVRTRKITPFSGFRIKSLGKETYARAIRSFGIFMDEFLKGTEGRVPDNFVVTLPKVTRKEQVKEFCGRIARIEKDNGLAKNAIGLELMIETPNAVIDKKGRVAVRRLVDAAEGRCTSVHFGAYDYTAALGISATHQDIRHPACCLARSLMQAALADTGVRISDSVTTMLPVPVHKTGDIGEKEHAENRRAVHAGWLKHFQNVSASMADGFYQSWDVHPNQLVARYAAVYAFFLTELEEQARRLRGFLNKATQASLTGNTFDDAASAQGLLNFFRRGRDCGAFDETEILNSTGLDAEDLEKNFVQLASEKR